MLKYISIKIYFFFIDVFECVWRNIVYSDFFRHCFIELLRKISAFLKRKNCSKYWIDRLYSTQNCKLLLKDCIVKKNIWNNFYNKICTTVQNYWKQCIFKRITFFICLSHFCRYVYMFIATIFMCLKLLPTLSFY